MQPISSLRPRFRRLGAPLLLALVCLALVTACGSQPRRVEGEPPVLTLDGMRLAADALLVSVRIANVNDEDLRLGALRLELTLDELEPVRSERLMSAPSVAPRSRELLEFEFAADPDVRRALGKLGRRELDNLSWELILIKSDERSDEDWARQQGFLHAVPGQADRFR